MKSQVAKDRLKRGICEIWNKTRENIDDNIFRGHTRSISTDVEDLIAKYISDVLEKEVFIFIDTSVRVDNKTHRPDLLIVKDDKVVALLEIKSNMGWCRDAKKVIDEELVNRDKAFRGTGTIECKFSGTDKESKNVIYDGDVKLFLIALTAQNGGSQEKTDKNKTYARKRRVSHYLLFNKWYDKLEDRDIDAFAEELLSLPL